MSILKKSAIGLDIAYQAFVFDDRTGVGSPNPTVNGTYHTINHAGSATFRLIYLERRYKKELPIRKMSCWRR